MPLHSELKQTMHKLVIGELTLTLCPNLQNVVKLQLTTGRNPVDTKLVLNSLWTGLILARTASCTIGMSLNGILGGVSRIESRGCEPIITCVVIFNCFLCLLLLFS